MTFVDDSAWRAAITSITVGGSTLASSAYSVSSGKITFTPSASTLLQSSGSKSIAVIATGYSNATVTQTIGVGAANKLAVTTQPAAPASNGAVLATQPAVTVQDQYGNTVTGSSAAVAAAVGSGTWTLGGTTTINASSGVATFSGLTATSAAAVTGATITFSSAGLTGTTSSTFNIPTPPPSNDLSSSPTSITVNGSSASGTTISATYTSITSDANSKADVWFSFTAPATGTVTLTSTSASSQDLDIEAWAGPSAPTSTTGQLIADGNGTGNTTEVATLSVNRSTVYFVRVLQWGGTSGTFTISATGPVGEPSITSITSGNGLLNVNFTPPSVGASTISNYKFSINGGTSFTTRSPASTSSPLLITGLANGTSYNVQILAVNSAGDGAPTASTAAVPYTVPGAPTITGITPGNGILSVAFSAPSSNGGSLITDYKYSTDGGSTFTSVGATTSPISISGLSNGTAYNVQIRAVNAAGDGTATASTSATPRTTPGAPTITTITPGNGQLSVAFSPPSSDGGNAVSNYDYSIDGGRSWTARSPANTASPLVLSSLANGTTYDVQIRAVNAAGSGTATSTTQGTPVAPPDPTITVSKASLAAKTTTYGTPSSAETFTVSGTTLGSGNLTVSAPTGFEVSTDGTTYFSSVNLTINSGIVNETTIYARLAATAAVTGSYNSQNISISGGGATTRNVATASAGNSVTAKTLSITGLISSTASKTYDGTTTANVTGTAVYTGLANGETFSVLASVTWSFPDKNAGNGKVLTRSADYTAPNGNYSLPTQPSLSADIAKKNLTGTFTAQSKGYDGNTTATVISRSVSSQIAGDDVNHSNGTATFDTAELGTGKTVTLSGATLTGVDAGNYTLTSVSTTTADITKGTALISFAPLPTGKKVGDGAFSAGATTTLGSISYSSSNPAVATVDGSGNITPMAPGVTSITATVNETNSYAGATVSRELTIGAQNITNTLLSENFSSLTAGGNSATTGTGSPDTVEVTSGLTSNFPTSVKAYSAGGAVKLGTASLVGSITSKTLDLSANGGVYTISFDVKGWTTVEGNIVVTPSSGSPQTVTYTATVSGSFERKTISFSGGTATTTLTIATSAKRAFLDNIEVTSLVPGAPAITKIGSFGAVNAVYGTPSAASATTATVTGGSLTANITAEAPSGFQVSTDGSTWGSTATFTQTDGFANGTLYLRLAANAPAG
ncbi:MAG: DUF1533 domain-containing protein, partial [Verrucomicrobia bacterium]|nr:DUF1533 domain-containing protein [Verrucomicrobiota bacterium]